MKDFNRVAPVKEIDTLNKGFMFDYIQGNFPYVAWQPVGYAVMDAFEKTFGGMNASARTVRKNCDGFITAIQAELGNDAGRPECVALVDKIRTTLQPASVKAKKAETAPVPGQP